MRGLSSAHLVLYELVCSHSKPALAAASGTIFQHRMQGAYVFLAQGTFGVIDYPIDTTEVIRSFNDIIHFDRFFVETYGIGLEDKTRLLVREATAFHVV